MRSCNDLQESCNCINDLRKENTALKQRIDELKTSFENERQNLHKKNKALTNDKVEALKQQLDTAVEALEKIAIQKYYLPQTVAKTALDSINYSKD